MISPKTSLHTTMGQYWVIGKTIQAFRLTWNVFKKLLQSLKRMILQKFLLTDRVADWLMPSDKHKLITAKAMGLIFHHSTSLQPKSYIPHNVQCILHTYNVQCILHGVLVFYLSLLTVKSVNLVVAHDGFLCIMKIAHIFHSGYFDYRGTFQLIYTVGWT